MSASIFTGVHNFFHSRTWNTIEIVAAAVIVLFWLATVAWVLKDARRRIENRWLIALCTLIGAFPPFLGPLIYMLFRPPEYLEDVRERDLEIKAIESRLGGPELKCKVCGAEVEHDFLVCPVCTTKLRSACTECQRPLEPSWQVCPYCETPVVGGAVITPHHPPRRSRSRSSSSG
jgi:RNA polymerase subunit RPABC4/transcription elongation factor Spt4